MYVAYLISLRHRMTRAHKGSQASASSDLAMPFVWAEPGLTYFFVCIWVWSTVRKKKRPHQTWTADTTDAFPGLPGWKLTSQWPHLNRSQRLTSECCNVTCTHARILNFVSPLFHPLWPMALPHFCILRNRSAILGKASSRIRIKCDT